MKRSTIYLEDDLYQALRLKAFESEESISSLVNAAVRKVLRKDIEDQNARRAEKPISYSAFLVELKRRRQI